MLDDKRTIGVFGRVRNVPACKWVAPSLDTSPLGSNYCRAILRCLIAANSDQSDTRFGMLSPEEVGVLERLAS